MGDLIRTIIKWAIVIILAIILIALIIHLINGTGKKNQGQEVKSIESIKLVDNSSDDDYLVDIDSQSENQNSNSSEKETEDRTGDNSLTVNVGDTGSTYGFSVWLGTVALCFSTYYVYKEGKKGSE